MTSNTENSGREITRRDFLKLVNAGVILTLLTSCVSEKSSNPIEKIDTAIAKQSTSIESSDQDFPMIEVADVKETPIPTETPAPEYPFVPNIENFRECYVPVEELLDGSYFRWLKDVIAPTLVPWFQEHEDKIKDVSLDSVDIPSGKVIVFDISTMPNFEDSQTAPFKRDVTFGHTSFQESDGGALLYRVLPIFYYIRETQQVHPVITVNRIYNEDTIEKVNNSYINDMNVTPIYFSDEYFGEKDPIVAQSFDTIGRDEMMDRMLQFLHDKNFSALSDEGIVLLTRVLKAPIYR